MIILFTVIYLSILLKLENLKEKRFRTFTQSSYTTNPLTVDPNWIDGIVVVQSYGVAGSQNTVAVVSLSENYYYHRASTYSGAQNSFFNRIITTKTDEIYSEGSDVHGKLVIVEAILRYF